MPKTPFLTVDCVLFEGESVLLVRRGCEPHKGCLALPGGFVDIGETVEEACSRELCEETSIVIKPENLILIGVYSAPERDQRFHTVSIAFLGKSSLKNIKAGDDALSVELVHNWKTADIAFDHKTIIEEADNLRKRLGYAA